MAEPQESTTTTTDHVSGGGEQTLAPVNSAKLSVGSGEPETVDPAKGSAETVVAGGEGEALTPVTSSVENKTSDEGGIVAPATKYSGGKRESITSATSVQTVAGGGETKAPTTNSVETKEGGEGEILTPATSSAKTATRGEGEIKSPVTSSVETTNGGGGETFSQLLAGAMGTTASTVSCTAAVPILALPFDSSARLPVVAVPCIIAPAALIESPGFTGPFAMTHQAVLATVTAQAQLQLQLHASHPSTSSDTSTISSPQPSASAVTPRPWQHIRPRSHEDHSCTPDAELSPSSRQKSSSARIVLRENSSDGYSWRKYGQKQVKSSDSSRSYYRCANANCSVKKKVQHFQDGRVIEIIYKGSHNHEPPKKTRFSRERKSPPSDLPPGNEEMELSSRTSNELDDHQSKLDENRGNASPQPLHCSSDCEEDAGIKNDHDCDEQDSKRRLIECPTTCSAQPLRIVRESKIVVHAASNSGLASDGYKWRKYGQKFVKGNPNPRSYYRCTQYGCPVRKHVERSSDDAKSFVIAYEGNHNHEQPSPRNAPDPASDESPSPYSAAAGNLMMSGGPKKEDETITQQNPKSEGLDDTDTQTDEQKSRLVSGKTIETTETQSSIGKVGNTASSQQTVITANHAVIPVKNS